MALFMGLSEHLRNMLLKKVTKLTQGHRYLRKKSEYKRLLLIGDHE